MQKKISLQFIFFILICFFIGGIVLSLESIKSFDDNMLVTIDELDSIGEYSFKDYMGVNYNDIAINTSASNSNDIVKSNIDLNLFGFIKVRTIPVSVINTNLYLCGDTVGIYIENKGVTIVGFGGIKNDSGIVYPFENTGIKIGDIVTKINDYAIASSKDIDAFFSNKNYSGEALNIEYISDGKKLNSNIYPVYDASTNSYRLGLWVRENATGIGTLTYITKNNRFGALGHGLSENGQKDVMQVSSGALYPCEVLGITKGQRGNAGEIKAMFKPGALEEGVVDKNNEYGVFGIVNNNCMYKDGIEIEAGGRLSVKPGKAYIYCQLNDDEVKKYEIEIIKTNYQTKSNQKSMVLRVTDKELLSKTGGIIQGMSGSPIVQDNKIVGAVTHVFVNDPTKGFGVYLDWMLEQ